MKTCKYCHNVLSDKEQGICYGCYEDMIDDEDDSDDWEQYQIEERRVEELQERAANCECGAWQMCDNGEVVHVADCCCGAE